MMAKKKLAREPVVMPARKPAAKASRLAREVEATQRAAGDGDDDLFADSARHESSPLGEYYQIPEIRIRREWPYFSDDQIENPDSQENVISAIDGLWFKLANSTTPINDTEFFGATSEYWWPDADEPEDLYRGPSAQPMIAIANYRHAARTFVDLLSHLTATTYPPPIILATMIREAMVYDAEAWHIVYHGKDADGAIKFLEAKRQEAVTLLRPTIAMFFASLYPIDFKAKDEIARYLSIVIHHETRTLSRGGRITKEVPAPLLWPVLLELVNAGENGITRHRLLEIIQARGNSEGGQYVLTNELKRIVESIGLTIPDGRKNNGRIRLSETLAKA